MTEKRRGSIIPRTSRKLSESNIYHIVIKGNNSQVLFFDSKDYLFFLKEIKKAVDEYDCKILAYCVMSNHIHLLMKFKEHNTMSNVFKSFGASFVPKYNYKHKRTGPLFNGRFYSSAVNDDAYLFMVLRYIHNNPVSANICNAPSEYQWSSYNDYFSNSEGKISDTDFIESMISNDEFLSLHKNTAKNEINDFIIKSLCDGVDDEELIDFYGKFSNETEITDIVDAMKRGKISNRRMERILKIPKKYI